MIPRLSPNYRLNDLGSFFLPAGKNAISRFEEQMAERAGHPHAIAFRYGRSGLYFLLKAMGIENKKVILPSYTCVVVAHAVVRSGNIPVFLDNEKDRFQPSPKAYLEAIDDQTAMIVPTHIFGISEECSDLYKTVKQKYPDVFVLQDMAHSFFCVGGDGKVVSQHGDGALFGMNISKLVNAVKGGVLTLRDAALPNVFGPSLLVKGKKRPRTALAAGFMPRQLFLHSHPLAIASLTGSKAIPLFSPVKPITTMKVKLSFQTISPLLCHLLTPQ